MDVPDEMQLQAKALADPSRFKLFRFVHDADGPVGVAELTELLGFNHNAIRKHLAVLVDAGVLAERDEMRKTRGRPRKQYLVRSDALSAFRDVSGSYERLASMLVDVAGGSAPYDVGLRAVSSTPKPGIESANQSLMAELSSQGFEPRQDNDTEVTLTHCPFADVATQNQEIVCELHRGMIDGHLATIDPSPTAKLSPKEPHQAGCRIALSFPVEISARRS